MDSVLKKYLFSEGNQSNAEKRNVLDDVLKMIGISIGTVPWILNTIF